MLGGHYSVHLSIRLPCRISRTIWPPCRSHWIVLIILATLSILAHYRSCVVATGQLICFVTGAYTADTQSSTPAGHFSSMNLVWHTAEIKDQSGKIKDQPHSSSKSPWVWLHSWEYRLQELSIHCNQFVLSIQGLATDRMNPVLQVTFLSPVVGSTVPWENDLWSLISRDYNVRLWDPSMLRWPCLQVDIRSLP